MENAIKEEEEEENIKTVNTTRSFISNSEKEIYSQQPDLKYCKFKKSRFEELINQDISTIHFYKQYTSSRVSRALKNADQVFDIDKYTFRIEKIIRIERSSDPNDVANKASDFSALSIRQLIEQGYNETLNLNNHVITR